jgi:hypothetical protein
MESRSVLSSARQIRTSSRFERRAFAILVLCGTAIGCGIASAPLKDTPIVAASPKPGELSIASEARPPVGSIVPVYISVANGTDIPRAIVPSQVFALDENGQRIAPLPAGEAAREAGGTGQLKAALTSAAVSGIGAGAVGAALGAAAGAAVGYAGPGAAIGSAYGGGEGILRGAERGQDEAKGQANQQISALALQGGEVRKDFTVGGYVFFPKGTYREIELLLVNSETGNTETIKEPWH